MLLNEGSSERKKLLEICIKMIRYITYIKTVIFNIHNAHQNLPVFVSKTF